MRRPQAVVRITFMSITTSRITMNANGISRRPIIGAAGVPAVCGAG